jgi:hypothetical protein
MNRSRRLTLPGRNTPERIPPAGTLTRPAPSSRDSGSIRWSPAGGSPACADPS